MKKILGLISILILMATLAYAEPTITQVYEAAKASKFTEANQMIEEVLKAHPQSAKAHFVNAEILSAQGQITHARAELKVAEQLEPGLPFAKPQAVQALKDNLGLAGGVKPVTPEHQQAAAPQEKPFPWTTVLIFGAGALVFIFLVKSAFSKKATPPSNGFNGATPPSAPYPNNGPMNNPVNPQGGGLGSNIASGLATGIGAGVGIAAGEALVNHFMNNNSSTPNAGHTTPTPPPVADTTPQPSSDFGGNDFGINDTASWDDNSSGDSLSDSSSDSW